MDTVRLPYGIGSSSSAGLLLWSNSTIPHFQFVFGFDSGIMADNDLVLRVVHGGCVTNGVELSARVMDNQTVRVECRMPGGEDGPYLTIHLKRKSDSKTDDPEPTKPATREPAKKKPRVKKPSCYKCPFRRIADSLCVRCIGKKAFRCYGCCPTDETAFNRDDTQDDIDAVNKRAEKFNLTTRMCHDHRDEHDQEQRERACAGCDYFKDDDDDADDEPLRQCAGCHKYMCSIREEPCLPPGKKYCVECAEFMEEPAEDPTSSSRSCDNCGRTAESLRQCDYCRKTVCCDGDNPCFPSDLLRCEVCYQKSEGLKAADNDATAAASVKHM